jgi:hypothetical protein
MKYHRRNCYYSSANADTKAGRAGALNAADLAALRHRMTQLLWDPGRMSEPEPRTNKDTYSPRAVLLALAFILLLVLGCLYLFYALRDADLPGICRTS